MVKNIIGTLAVVLFFILPSSILAQQMEVAFSLQNNSLTWFAVDDPTIQGSISVTGLSNSFEGNALAYDPDAHRLLFVNGTMAANRPLWAVNLSGLTLNAGEIVEAGAAINLGTLNFGAGTELFGGAYYNGAYYTLINGGDTLRRVAFNSDGSILSASNIDLPGRFTMYLGDFDFDSNGNLWISGNNSDVGPSTSASRIWKFSTVDGVNFTQAGVINNNEIRYNGILFDLDDNLYGYRLGSSVYGSVSKDDGSFTPIYTGDPFGDGGDLTRGFLMNVAVPEPSGALLVCLTGLLALLRRRRTV